MFRGSKQAYLFVLPAIILIAVVSVYPILYAIDLSLYKTHYLKRVQYVGLANYSFLLLDRSNLRNFLNSMTYVFGSLIIVIPFSLFVALVLNKPLKLRSIFRAIIITPWVVSQTIVALLWGWLLNPDFGPGSYFLTSLGIGKINLLGNPTFAMPTLIMINVWGSYPMPLILFLAALQTIPVELEEAARADGASGFTYFRFITLPLIRSTILIAIILLTLLYFNMVTLIFILTAGGPVGATEVLSLRAFNEGFQFWRMGFAASIGIVIFTFNIIFSLLYIKLLRMEKFY